MRDRGLRVLCVAALLLVSTATLASRDCAECPEMVSIAGGTFLMGDALDEGEPHESPAHEVRVSAFAISRHEISFDQWDACARAGACNAAIWDQDWGRGAVPAINVHWGDARDYARWLVIKTGLKYRLPTEAEWEYAARAGSSTTYPWGTDMQEGVAVCYSECGSLADKPFPVGSTKPNAFGLHDMIGNVYEWVQDCWNASYQGAPSDGSAWEQGDCEQRVTRGGAWLSLSPDLRSSLRAPLPWNIRFHTLGFRVVRED